MNPTLRVFSESDTEKVIALWEQTGLTRPWNDPHKDILRKLSVQSDCFFVAVWEDQIIATLMAGYDGHRGWLNYLAVAPDWQRKGVGRMIVAHAEERLKAIGCPKINLQIRDDNRNAIAFYEGIGFREDSVVSYGKRLETDDE